MQLPTWTQANDQDDLIWYKTTKDSNTTYSAIISVAEHNLESGRYNVHVYGTSAVTNALTGLAGTHFEADYHFGDVAVDATLAKDGIDLTMPSDVSKGWRFTTRFGLRKMIKMILFGTRLTLQVILKPTTLALTELTSFTHMELFAGKWSV